MINVSDKNLDKNQITQFIFCNFSENVEECGGAGQAMYDNITRRMLIPCRITKATNTHSEYVILIVFSSATVVNRTCLSVTLYVYCLP